MTVKNTFVDANQGYKTQGDLDNMYEEYLMGHLTPSPKQGLVINPKVGYFVTDSDITRSIPYEWIKRNSSIYGVISKLSERSPVSNLNWDYIHFVNSDYFRPAAIAFEKSQKAVIGTQVKPSYTSHVKGTKSHADFWTEEFRRITTGYEPIVDGKPCGIRISGEFYFYLNYGRINKVVEYADGSVKDVESFPSFLAMDYYYYCELEARENPERFGFSPDFRRSMAVVKSRRKGFSFKAAAGCVWIAAFNNNARVGIASEANSSDETDAVKCAKKCLPIIDHLTTYTPFGRTEPGDPQTNGGWKHEIPKLTKAQVSITLGIFNTRTKEKRGRQSTIFTMSLSKDDAASGEGLHRLYFEESGKVGNLDKAWIFARESMKAGSLYKGIAVLYGTGGEMVSSSGKEGSSKPFSAIFNNPDAAEIASYENIYEYRDTSKRCGYFICDMWSNFGSFVICDGEKYTGLDKMGNAYFWVAELALNKERSQKMPPNGKQADYNQFLTQRCKTPSEAFLVGSSNYFNTPDLIARRNEIKMSRGGFEKFRTAGTLIEKSDGQVSFSPDLTGELMPITSMDMDNSNREGCLLVYEHPRSVHGVIPDGAYIITVDSIAQDNSGGESINSVIVIKTPKYASIIGDEKIVATYHGRAAIRPLDYLHKLLVKLSKYYNAKITFENDRDGGILAYFASRSLLEHLLPLPGRIVKKNLPNSKTLLREFGHPMSSDRHKSIGERYLNEWLDFRHSGRRSINSDSEIKYVEGKRNLDMIEDEFLLEQLINYNRKGNFDATLSLMGGIIQLAELFPTNSEDFIEDYSAHLTEVQKQLFSYFDEKFNTNSLQEFRNKPKGGTRTSREFVHEGDEYEYLGS